MWLKLDITIAFFEYYTQLHTFAYMDNVNIDKPTPVRLKDLKIPLQQEASKIDRSLNWLILSIIKEYPVVKEYIRLRDKKNKQ